MTKVAALFLILGAFCLSIFGQTQTRPTPAPGPPVLRGETGTPTNNGNQPPVIQGGAGPLSGSPTTSPSPSASPARKRFNDDETIKVDTNLVTTPVSVLDRNGRFIPGLKLKDFKIFENEVAQKPTYFQSEEQPFTVFLLIDISPSTKYKIDEIHYAALTFVNQLRANDKVMVIAFDQRIHLLTEEPTSDKQKLYAAIYKANFGSGTSLYEAVSFVTDLDLVKVTGRKAIVIFSDGVDTTSRRATYQSTIAGIQEIDALVYPVHYNTVETTGGVVSSTTGAPMSLPPDIAALMAARGIAIDPRAVRVVGNGTTPQQFAKAKQYFDALATNSGGRMFAAESITNLDSAFQGVAEELRRQYSIGYYPEETGTPGERRSVKIKVTRPGAIVRAKTGYIVRQPAPQADKGPNPGDGSTTGR